MAATGLVELTEEHTRKQVETLLSTGFTHHSYLHEQEMLKAVLTEGKDQDGLIRECTELYMDLLGDSRMRSMKNGMICLLTVVSRSAITFGVDAEYSFAASDYFINLVEKVKTTEEMFRFCRHVLKFYATLVSESRIKGTSSLVSRSIRYILSHLYGPLKVQDVAEQVNMNPQAFSRLFSAQTGQTPSDYIEERKLEEAKSCLRHGMSIAETADALGYCSPQQFSLRFRKRFDLSPGQWRDTQDLI